MRLLTFLALMIIGLMAGSARAEVGAACGGFAGLPCGAAEYCNYGSDAMCGAGDAQGKCAPRPDVCTEVYQPVCGCDGKPYSNACKAAAAGASVAYAGTCRMTDTSRTTCIQAIACGTKDGVVKEYPTPCDAAADGATDIMLKTGASCPAVK